ncbi:hypothetical protein Caci_7526 [Catenulispora acidiphila DSM 44928]|uniref:Uncharacterized protein n=1 Tax=Catenulispora acidiphila (strain DSM 44928 / JCM 14897 / NBRC 102108 / NRRL B-24433 / ID139908) TaxID=479433 RepID=C7QB60_CATAD|nr:hypothetical protein [Catenulispora acidiphila]ACU76351.1 hypothetical protein Caci_7526 [Catenulispora acidiphila DSM 44928]
MSTDTKIVVGVVVTGLSACLAAVAAHVGWSFWPALLGIPLVFAAVAVGSHPGGRSYDAKSGDDASYNGFAPSASSWTDGGLTVSPPLSVMLPGVEHECPQPRMRLRSAADGYDFRFAATVRWRESANMSPVAHSDLAAVARSAIIRRAADLLASRDPGEVALVEAELAGALGARLSDATGLLEAWAGDVSLTLSDADSERMRRLTEIRKDEQVWESEREYEKHRRAYLGGDVLKSAGSAVVWALARKEDSIERAVDLIGPLALLSAAANDTDVAPVFRHLVAPEFAAQNGHVPSPPDASNDYDNYGDDDDHADPEPARANGVPRTTPDYIAEMADHLGFTSSDHRNLFVGNIVNVLKSMERPDDAESVRRAFYPQQDLDEPLFDVGEPAPAASVADGPVAGSNEFYDPYEP